MSLPQSPFPQPPHADNAALTPGVSARSADRAGSRPNVRELWEKWQRPRQGPIILLVLAWCAVLFFFGITRGELWRTESLRAIIAAEMLDSGNWLVPRLYGEPLFTKPPGMYAAIALCSLPWGRVTEFSARLPSALAATGCVLLFWWYFKRQLGRVAGLAA